MRADQTGIVVARGIGLGLILLGVCHGASTVTIFEPSVSSGWTSYSPLTSPGTSTPAIDYSYATWAGLWLPCLAQLTFGSALILFSKPVGRWLARGVREGDGANE